jgi:hypothetical protein
VGANEATDPRKRVVLSDQFDGLGILPLADEGNIAGHINSRGAGHLARGRSEDIALAGRAIVRLDVAGKDLPVQLKGLSHNPNDGCGRLFRLFHGDRGYGLEDGLQVIRASRSRRHILDELKKILPPSSDPRMGETSRVNELREAHEGLVYDASLIGHGLFVR